MSLAGQQDRATTLLGYEAPGTLYQIPPDCGPSHGKLSLLPRAPSCPASHPQLAPQLGHGVPLQSKMCSFKFSCPH